MAKRKKTVLDGILYFINIVVAIALLFSYLAYYFDPQLLTFFAFFGLAYPILLGLNLLFIVYWILRFKLKLALSLVCIGVGYLHIPRFYQFSNKPTVVNVGDQLRLMSYNVRLFNQYEWLPTSDVQGRISQLVQEENPDVLAIQEYLSGPNAPDFGYPYRYQDFDPQERNTGLVIFSKFPIDKSGVVSYGKGPQGEDAGKAIYADISFQGKKVRLFNVYLASVGLQQRDYENLRNPGTDRKAIQENAFKIVKQLNKAFVKRSHQVKLLEEAVENSPHSTILMGDFNDTPNGYAYHRVNLLLDDSYVKAGQGWSRTYTQGPLPFRIDHIFHSEELKSQNYEIISEEYSDHYPVVTELNWR